MSRPIQQRFGKLSPTNGGAIQVYSDALRGKTIRARLLLKNGKAFFDGSLRISNGTSPFINGPKRYVQGWIRECGRNESDLRGYANDRNSVYSSQAGGVTNLHFAELDYSSTVRDSRDSSLQQSEEVTGARKRKRNRSFTPTTHENARPSCETWSITQLRVSNWTGIPNGPGVYWWYFPERHLELFGISRHCNLEDLQLRRTTNGKLCLYIGIAKNLRERIKWHAEQRLSQSALRSRALSTLRFSLIALAKLNYNSGDDEINRLMDELDVSWISTRGKPEAEAIESSQLSGDFRFPLNIRGNHRVETARFVRYLKEQRKTYRRRYLD